MGWAITERSVSQIKVVAHAIPNGHARGFMAHDLHAEVTIFVAASYPIPSFGADHGIGILARRLTKGPVKMTSLASLLY